MLRIIEPPAGIDLAFSFELSESASEQQLAPAWTTPPRDLGGFSMRRLAWLGVAAVLLLTLLLPALNLVNPQVAGTLRSVPLMPDDSLWLAGAVHEKHAAVSVACETCHVQPFQRVPDSSCSSCHEAHRHASAPAPAVLGDMRCASCHLEHNEPPMLISEHQGLCADCHADGPVGTDLPPAADFLDAHPPFRVSLLTALTDSDWQPVRSLLSEASEQSNLKFNHELHVHADGVVAPDGRRQLKCADCHVPEAGGARMQPVEMEKHCSSCHTLSFDPADPARTVPHGDPAAVLQVLTEYYSARLLGDDAPQAGQRLRRPGQTLSREDRDRVANEARNRAREVATDLIERRACSTCHEVSRQAEAEGGLWQVQPVRLTSRFFPQARFSHAAHGTGVTACADCHAAQSSDSATDLLMPAMDSCRNCHGSGDRLRNEAQQSASTCILCHEFHNAEKATYP